MTGKGLRPCGWSVLNFERTLTGGAEKRLREGLGRMVPTHLLHAECDLAPLEAGGAPRHIVARVELWRDRPMGVEERSDGSKYPAVAPCDPAPKPHLLQGLRQVLIELLLTLAQLLDVPLQVLHRRLHLQHLGLC